MLRDKRPRTHLVLSQYKAPSLVLARRRNVRRLRKGLPRRPRQSLRVPLTVLLFARLQLADLAHHLFLAARKLVDVALHSFVAGRELVDVPRYLLLRNGDPINGLPHRVEINRYALSR
jgi:hypothetical protein